MFVENLTVFGFKSFNQKITLDFGAGISGIIGPNGCGKSNIVDAIRWVLGEQSTKQLRGTKMEDVIFNGSRNEKPMSIAQVELTLNNERGRLPIDYSTVKVGRRLYRSGASEYTINKNVVRLKDVRELFLDTGMGSHAYSVIERQMVDNILSDTTGHRRFLFEEAAGIMKYKTRKKEALNKLDATQRDLLRVNDIISEVERQVNSLKRQVGKARRYRSLMEEIRELDLNLSQTRRLEWLQEIAGLDAEFGSTRRVAEEAETHVASLEARLQELHVEALEKERVLQEAREAMAQVDDEAGRVNGRIMVYRERLETTRRKIVESGEHRVRIADRLDRNRLSDTETAERLVALEATEGKERSTLDRRESELAEAEELVRSLRREDDAARREVRERFEARVRAQSAAEDSERRTKELESRVASMDARREALETERAERTDALEISRKNVSGARQRLASLESDLEAWNATWREHQAATEALRRELGERREQEAAVRSRLETLEGLRAAYEGFAPGVRALMTDGLRPDGVLGTLSDLVQVPAAWVSALEPALSTAWQYIVTENTATASRLMDRLQEESLGFANFLPLDRVPEGPAAGGEGLRASEVVETDARTRALVRYLLGDLVLTETLEEALDLVARGVAPRAATRDGRYVDGAVLGGGTGGPEGGELLEREEGLARCRSEIGTLVEELAALTAREEEIRKEGERLQRDRDDLLGRIEESQTVRSSLEKEMTELALHLRHAEEALGELERARAALMTERGDLDRRRETLSKELDEAGRAAEAAQADQDDVAKRLQEAEAERETTLAAVNELRVSWARLEGDLRDVRAARERLAHERTDLAEEQERTRVEEEDAVAQRAEIESELETLADRVQELHGIREKRAAIVAEREREKDDASAREQQESESIREERRKAGRAREAAHGTEVRLTQLRTDLKHLEERLIEEYDLGEDDLRNHVVGDIPDDAQERLAASKEKLRRIGPVNLLAVEEYEEKSERLAFMTTQRDDLVAAKTSLVRTIEEINKKASGMFLDTFGAVQQNFQKTFQVLFQGGQCELTLSGDDPLEADIMVVARPRGKRPQGIHQLSSGERALTAIALLFAIYLVKPSPFCILDEVDAPLDDANIDRFVAMIKEFSKRTQFIMITHSKKTMEAADRLYGVTMQRPGVSQILSVKLDGREVELSAADRAATGLGDAPVGSALAGATLEHGNGNRAAAGEGDDEPFSPESSIPQ